MLGRAQIRNAPAKGVAAKGAAAKSGAKSVAVQRPPAGHSAWQTLWRQAGWGLAATAALGVAVLSGRDDAAPQKVGGFAFVAEVAVAAACRAFIRCRNGGAAIGASGAQPCRR